MHRRPIAAVQTWAGLLALLTALLASTALGAAVDYRNAGNPPDPRWQINAERRAKALPQTPALPDQPLRIGDWTAQKRVEISGNRAVLRERVRLPQVVKEPGGRAPLVLILHGNHGACRDRQGIDRCPTPPAQSCAPGETRVYSAEGMNWLAESLARQGLIAAVVDAEPLVCAYGAQAGFSRVELALAHLQAWRSAQREGVAGIDPGVAAAADLSRVVLIGHSVGGDAALEIAARLKNWPATSPAPAVIRGTLLIAPPDWLQSRADSAPLGVVLPSCDGDVYTQAGREIVARALAAGNLQRVGLWQLVGGHHNAANTAWPSEADDVGKGLCPRASAIAPEVQRGWLGQLAIGFVRATASQTPWPAWLYGEASPPPLRQLDRWPEVRSLVIDPGHVRAAEVQVSAERVDALTRCAVQPCSPAPGPSEFPGWKVRWSRPGFRLEMRWSGQGPPSGQRALLRLASLPGSPRHRPMTLRVSWQIGARWVPAGTVEVLPPLDHAGSYGAETPPVVRMAVELPQPVPWRAVRAVALEGAGEDRGELHVGELIWAPIPPSRKR